MPILQRMLPFFFALSLSASTLARGGGLAWIFSDLSASITKSGTIAGLAVCYGVYGIFSGLRHLWQERVVPK